MCFTSMPRDTSYDLLFAQVRKSHRETMSPLCTSPNERLHPFLCQRFSPHPSSFPTMFPILLVYPASQIWRLTSLTPATSHPRPTRTRTRTRTRTHAAHCQEVAPA
ncbi:unnamed protein product [Leuciscus chuanchicus]